MTFTLLTSDLLLPLHFIVEIFCLLEKVIHFAPLFIPLRCVEHTALGLSSEEFTDVGDWKDDLLHSPVMPDNLKTLICICFSPLYTPSVFVFSMSLCMKYLAKNVSQ
jgi:hypothetical protein